MENSLTCSNLHMSHNFICVKNTWVVCWDCYLEPDSTGTTVNKVALPSWHSVQEDIRRLGKVGILNRFIPGKVQKSAKENIPFAKAVKKAERQKIDAFELWYWRRLLRVPWTARRSNQSILKEISPGCSLEGLMLKLKLQYFGHLMRRVDSLEKALMLGGIGGRKRRE